ncbi:MAG: putative toxin-antitoxin system toxin component, PIN family [Woeseiaceae bacterium]|nr:putative toxin-antitoxin system toxin component, PIN family [Woeseiaceae bacterium]
MSPPVFVVDTNVVVAGLVTGSSSSPVALALDGMLSGTLVFLLSPALLDEYRAVLTRPKLVKLHGFTEAQVDQLLVELTANAIWREPKPDSPAPDPGDDQLWSLLSACPESILVTGDRLLLENPPSRSSVISPGTWLSDFVSNEGRAR